MLFFTPPFINFYAKCYLWKLILRQISKGNIHYHIATRKVVTLTDSCNLPYYSIKDISGLFLFKLNVSEFKKKCFIKFFLEKEINFVDSVVYMDNEQKNYFEKKRFYD